VSVRFIRGEAGQTSRLSQPQDTTLMTFHFPWLSGELTAEETHGSVSFKCAHLADCQLITPLSLSLARTHTHTLI